MSSSQRFCSECGAAIDVAAKFCSGCGTQVNAPAEGVTAVPVSPASASSQPATLSLEERREILHAELGRYALAGYRVVAQTDTTAQLIRPKTFSCLIAAVLLAFTFGILLVPYLIWYVARRDEQVYLEIDERGRVVWNGQRLPGRAQPASAVMLRGGDRFLWVACGHANSPNRQRR
jgi:zinc-ribbon domain